MGDDDSKITRREATRRMVAAAGGMALAASTTTGGQTTELEPLAIPIPERDQFRRQLRGPVYFKYDQHYESSRKGLVWNGRKPDRKPDVIVHAGRVEDVQAAVRFAKAKGLKVAVRGGGHSWTAASVREGGVCIDVGGLSEMRLDEARAILSAGPGTKNTDVEFVLTPKGLAFPVGHCPGVPLSGYVLSGGFGWNTGAWGPACMSVRGMQIVTADGEVVTASETENADLFWAARGAGSGFFGVVTRYDLQAYLMPRAIRSMNLVFRLDDAPAVGKWLGETVPTLAKEVELTCALREVAPAKLEGVGRRERTLVVNAVAFGQTEEQSQQMLQPLLAPPAGLKYASTPVAATSFELLLKEMGSMFLRGPRYGADVSWCNAAADEVLTRAVKAMSAAPSRLSNALIVLLPPPPRDFTPPDVALSMFGQSLVAYYGLWRQDHEDAANLAWLRASADALRDIAAGHYVGEADLTASPDRPRRCFAPAAWEKLRFLKARYDPAGVFHDFPTAG